MNFHHITKCDMLNGAGARVVLWVAGCDHACPGCHNRQTWDHKSGILFDGKALDELEQALSEEFCAGLTLSGGDPLSDQNYETCLDIARWFKETFPTKTLWVYTGYTYEQLLDLEKDEMFIYADTLVDGRFEARLKQDSLPYRGSTNQRLIYFKKDSKDLRLIDEMRLHLEHCNEEGV